ncbi:tetratricopeptide repeat protein [Piscinibacter koreensis]|uniref:protein O-GlcNAc transferase n=1 Tax=Piscinibacter koreensis TaxID=2742824 RepID=A0A7Y6TX69_9BURK|nr:tetratricopeptide repeat protein [Schlegelella koreensis]NUZ06843.1 tetratricopeptide repeat protein [Schlegelella koreensis]
MTRPGRNDRCPCGSGRKYKQCCMGAAAPAPAPRPVGLLDLLQAGVEHHQAGRLAEAQARYQQVLALEPQQPDALNLMGALAFQVGQTEIALRLVRQAIAVQPDHVDAGYNLGRILFETGAWDEAGDALERVIALRPAYAAAHGNLGCVRQAQGRLDAAAERFRAALALDPGNASTWSNLGAVLKASGESAEALACYARAVDAAPGDASIHANLGLALTELGRFADAVQSYRRALALRPGDAATWSSLLFAMLYDPAHSPKELFAEHARYANAVEGPLRGAWAAHPNRPDPARRLKVGYVSADLRRHPVAHFIEPVLVRRDAGAFELFAYYNHAVKDATSERLASRFDHWIDCQALDDDALAARIRADGIDILIDVSGHSQGNRLPVFARRPAPVQVTWLGYPFTSGLTAIDHRISDALAEPPGMTEHLNAEALWRLPGPFCCYQPPALDVQPPEGLPKDAAGALTFGCFNNFTKVADDVLAAWARILAQLPEARLLLEINGLGNASYRDSVETRLLRLGLPLGRVILEPRRPENQFVLYNRIDIALDPFPCNGGTTTFDALWMGVPVVSVAGRHFPSRMGATILGHAGLGELVADGIDGYVDLAVALARDEDRLRRIRHGLRERVAGGALLDARAFARHWHAALRGMWERWCERDAG